MPNTRIVYTDETLAEFDGDFPSFVHQLASLVGGDAGLLPPLSDSWWTTEAVAERIDQLIEHLNTLAPAGFAFGAHIDAPECFGFWPKG